MTRGQLIEVEGSIGETRETRLLSRWVIDRSSGRPALRIAWYTADATPEALSVRMA